MKNAVIALAVLMSIPARAQVFEGDPDSGSERRRLEVCGRKYTHDMDSMNDYSAERTPAFPVEVKALANAHDAYLAKLLVIQNARRTLDVSTYELLSDP